MYEIPILLKPKKRSCMKLTPSAHSGYLFKRQPLLPILFIGGVRR